MTNARAFGLEPNPAASETTVLTTNTTLLGSGRVVNSKQKANQQTSKNPTD